MLCNKHYFVVGQPGHWGEEYKATLPSALFTLYCHAIINIRNSAGSSYISYGATNVNLLHKIKNNSFPSDQELPYWSFNCFIPLSLSALILVFLVVGAVSAKPCSLPYQLLSAQIYRRNRSKPPKFSGSLSVFRKNILSARPPSWSDPELRRFFADVSIYVQKTNQSCNVD